MLEFYKSLHTKILNIQKSLKLTRLQHPGHIQFSEHFNSLGHASFIMTGKMQSQ